MQLILNVLLNTHKIGLWSSGVQTEEKSILYMIGCLGKNIGVESWRMKWLEQGAFTLLGLAAWLTEWPLKEFLSLASEENGVQPPIL